VKKSIRPAAPIADHDWRNLDEEVEIELTSEHPDCPIEGALLPDGADGWRADAPGAQTISLSWPSPITISRIRLVFEELGQSRTQEFVIRAGTNDGMREVVRQQFTFSPPGTTVEREEYSTNLDRITRLELTIIPAIDGGAAVATLREWRVA
jgi:hypothetical protein